MIKKAFFSILDALEGEITIEALTEARNYGRHIENYYPICFISDGRDERRLLSLGVQAYLIRPGGILKFNTQVASSRSFGIYKENWLKFNRWFEEWKRIIMEKKETRPENKPILIKTEVVSVSVPLTDEEIETKTKELTDAILDKERITGEKKTAVEKFNDLIKARDEIISDRGHVLHKKAEMRDMECEIHVDRDKRRVHYIDPNTKLIMKETDANDEDMQLALGE